MDEQAQSIGIVPRFEDIDLLSEEERKAIMVVREGKSEDAPVERLLRNVFVWAIVTHSSDVHIKSRGDRQRPIVKISVRSPKGLVNAEYRGHHGKHFETKLFQLTATPQGGSTPDIESTRFTMELPARFARAHGLNVSGDRPYRVGMRVEYIQAYDGFSFVCRLIDQQRAPKLHELGLSYALMQSVMKMLAEPNGLVLVSGPTGSGKSTLLRAMIDVLNDGTRTIHTIEDPVEYQHEGPGPITQIEVRGDITFPRALRSTLRQDPEVILIGEIRDMETMDIALQAAQTGHLVFATVHANNATETLSRALDLTKDKSRDVHRLAETVRFVMAQRLLTRYDGPVRSRRLVPDEQSWLRLNGLDFMESVSESESGERCGRAALIEAFSMTPEIKDVLRSGQLNASSVYRLARDQLQYETLAGAGVRAVLERGCRFSECRPAVESNTDARQFPELRSRLARSHGLSLAQVSHAIDAFCRAEQEERQVSLEDCLDAVSGHRVKGQAHEPL